MIRLIGCGPRPDVLVPEVSDLVDEWYRATPAALDGMPPHVTILYPWVDAPVSPRDLQAAEAVLEGVGPFELALTAAGRFQGVLYLVPDSGGVLEALMASFWRAFPATPPYGGAHGAHPAPIPHLTIARGDEVYLDAVEATIRARLTEPLRLRVDEIHVSEEGLAPGGRWAVRTALPLASGDSPSFQAV